MGPRLRNRDHELIQIVDAALAEAARQSGPWLACKPGCTQCCVGPFAINALDVARLRAGWRELRKTDPQRAREVKKRAEASVGRLAKDYPGDPLSGMLDSGEEAERKFAAFANDEPCPALDPHTGLCDLYESRPMTCRIFGPPVRSAEGIAVCELCFQGTSKAQILSCEMIPDPGGLEEKILQELESRSGAGGETIVAFCLAHAR